MVVMPRRGEPGGEWAADAEASDARSNVLSVGSTSLFLDMKLAGSSLHHSL